MAKILCITLFGEIGGSSRVRVLQYIPYLEKNGIKCTAKKLFSDEYFKIITNQKKCNPFSRIFYSFFSVLAVTLKRIKYTFDARKYDAVIIQKDVFPLWLQKLLKIWKSRIIFEYDDTIFEISQDKGFLKRIYDMQRIKNLPHLLKMCSHVIAENSYLADYAKKFKNEMDVSIITAPIDTDEFSPKTGSKTRAGNKVVLGWIGSSFTTKQLKLLSSALEKIGRKYSNNPNAVLRLIGADDNSIKFDGIKVEKVKWSLDTAAKELQDFDIGLMPLDEHPFNKGRLGYKMIQYMAVGIPIVASNVGLNKDVIIEGKNGFLASNENDCEEWVEKLSLLIENPGLRKKLGENGRKMAVEKYSLDIAKKRLLGIVRKALL